MTNANECTCPSGDGSLRHPCPAHPESVELAGVTANLTFINGRPAMCGCQVEYSSGGGEYSDVIYVTLCAKHSGSAILDLVATNRIALTPEHEGQWHADLYLDREVPLAKAEGATPAEAVLALMSADRIDPEQESVEQAGGDERVKCAVCVDSGKVYDISGEGPWKCYACTGSHEVVGYANGDELDNMLDDRTAVLSPVKTSFHTVPVYREARAALAQPSGEVVVTKNESGAIVSVTRQDKEGRVLSVIAESQPSPAPTTSGYDQLWGWFGLSRSAYAVLPRVMMHAMPDDWQARFAELMDKWDDHWPNQPDITAHVQIKQNNRFISTPPWLLNYRHPDHNQLNAMRGKDEL